MITRYKEISGEEARLLAEMGLEIHWWIRSSGTWFPFVSARDDLWECCLANPNNRWAIVGG